VWPSFKKEKDTACMIQGNGRDRSSFPARVEGVVGAVKDRRAQCDAQLLEFLDI
jgi:hypothetical protein